MCVLFSPTSFVRNKFLTINVYPDTPEMWPEMYVGLHIEYPLFLSHLNQNCKAANINLKNFHASDLMKCCQHCSVVCMQTDRQTIMWQM
jgi:hypothetical protein